MFGRTLLCVSSRRSLRNVGTYLPNDKASYPKIQRQTSDNTIFCSLSRTAQSVWRLGYDLDDREIGVQFQPGVRYLFSAQHPGRFLSPSSYPMGPGGPSPKVNRPEVKLTTQFRLLLRWSCGRTPPIPLRLFGVVLN
jgi:hypothetical protein